MRQELTKWRRKLRWDEHLRTDWTRGKEVRGYRSDEELAYQGRTWTGLADKLEMDYSDWRKKTGKEKIRDLELVKQKDWEQNRGKGTD